VTVHPHRRPTARPRLFGIPATDAPVVAVLRRGPSAWAHVGRWELDPPVYRPGSWLRATVYPQRCDLSPDGRWLSYFALDAHAHWAAGSTYVAVSRLPWVSALAAWGTQGTWTRGLHFVSDRSVQEAGAPDAGSLDLPALGCGLAVTRAASFAVERRRGWTETADTPPRAAQDMWDEQRAVRMTKPQPGAGSRPSLVVRGRAAAFRSGASHDASYTLHDSGTVLALPGVQWADWASDGSLLVATTDGHLQIRHYAGGSMNVHWQHDVWALTPDPQKPPKAAHLWR
jgi:hypothetical protein